MAEPTEDRLRQPVDLTNCDREPIHIPGRIQSFGALIAVSHDWLITHTSENAAATLGLETDDLLGEPLTSFVRADALHDIRTRLQMLGDSESVERLFGVRLTDAETTFAVAVHLSGRSIILEIEPEEAGRRRDYVAYVRPMVDRIRKTRTIEQLCAMAARQVKALTEFDRVMVYRFAPDDTGEVIAEAKPADMEPFLGLRYPATDIPQQARALYTRNLLRIISDVGDPGAAVEPVLNPQGEPLDLSLSTTRAVSPIHLEYLRNMGVGASMSISILLRGKLWGLFACHHRTPKILPYELRTAAELFGQLFGFVLDEKRSDIEREEAARARLVHDRIMAQLADGRSIGGNFEAIADAIETVIPFDGAIAWVEGEFRCRGTTPTREAFTALLRFLNTTGASQVYATECLSQVFPPAAAHAEQAAGILVLPVSRSPRDYMVLFRREIAKTVTWAGNPDKSAELVEDGFRLSPRKSFEAWKQEVSGHSAPWTATEIQAAETIRVTLLEVVLRITDASMRERARSHERQELLIAELNHRVRNILTLIRSLVSQSAAEAVDITSFTQVIGGRIHALARANDQITRESWNPAPFAELVQTEAAAYLAEAASRIEMSGPGFMLHPTGYTTMSLVLHEMITNSVKYGALGSPAGVVTITLTELPDGGAMIEWRERGGPPVQAPMRRGFGSTIIERSIPYDLSGEAEIRFEVAGVQARFTIPKEFVAGFGAETGGNAPLQRAAPATQSPASLIRGAALLVEDNMIIALDAEDLLREFGAQDVFVAGTVAGALRIIDEEAIEVALLDLNLGAETSERVAETLAERGIPFAFGTGYGDAVGLAKDFPDVPVVQKPFAKDSLASALARCLKQP